MRATWCLVLGMLLSGCTTREPRTRFPTPADSPAELIVFLKDADPDVRFHARLAIMKRGQSAVPLLTEALASEDCHCRFEAAAALNGMQSVRRREAVPALKRVLGDADPGVRENAIQALGSIGPDARQAATALRTMLRDTTSPQCRHAVTALARVLGADAVPDLVEALKAEATRIEALDALGEIGPAASAALPAIERLVQADNPMVRETAAKVLLCVRPPAAGQTHPAAD